MVKYIGVETIFLYIVTTYLLTRIKKYNLVGMIIDINWEWLLTGKYSMNNNKNNIIRTICRNS